MTAVGETASGTASVPVVSCLGVPVTAHTREGAARRVVDRALHTREAREAHRSARAGTAAFAPAGSDVHLCNAYTLALADRDPVLLRILRSAFLNLADGQPVVWANQLLHRGTALPRGRVYGPDLMLDVFSMSQGTGLRHYLLGSTPEVLAALQRELRRRFPRAVLAGSCSPPFRSLTAQELRDQEEDIRTRGADIVWVGLGTPLQDHRAAELSAALPVVTMAVGAAFDFIAGSKRQAPSWMQQGGLEWLFRLGCEPRRLWRRYLFGNARFIGGAVRQAALRRAPRASAPPARSSDVGTGLTGRRERAR
ncbi:WecB/TagA/CpsF family glycosyltransferase [Streptomyces sp. S07_1.15]|uniref:WecB/TagA/CpsF family glycosyltransferase n=1 Tax=Streptomyces sp. S07_1.15 TaxID=2873925 RepID=UPI001D156BCC|nr:WecB/TagA/CpsF family glycosyltransferase [Streptomyces sp. S07_1.15]MCC3652577.1 WecB/TagA/CpsF family glycosyltransferase [Streptomyces sp. S07_1.15]